MAISSLDVLTCIITIGDEDSNNIMNILNPIVLTEVQNIEIHDSYKELIGTAVVTFPKGTVFKSTIIKNVTLEGKDATKVTTEIMADGIVIEKRQTQTLLDDLSIKVGQRIRIQIGYNELYKTMFDGYVVKYNAGNPIILKCENLAYKLKLKQAPKISTENVTVNDLCEDKYNLLKDTGFKLHSDTRKFKINIGKVQITDNFTIADIFNAWKRLGFYVFLKYDANAADDAPRIAVGRPYSNSKTEPLLSDENLSTGPYKIYFNYHVPSNGDNLTVLKVDPKFLAVMGKAADSNQKMFSVTVRLNPEYDPNDPSSKEFQTINATQLSKKTYKVTGNATAKGARTKTRVDLSTYHIVPYTSNKIGITEDELVEECIKYFKDYNLNGIEGNLTIFGDLGLRTAVQVELIDTRNPSKNGVYIVEEVTTTFGVNGYRQKLTLPYKIKGAIKYGSSK